MVPRLRKKHPWALVPILIFLLSLLSGCGSGREEDTSISWVPCGENLQCGGLSVPLDYEDPDGGEIDLALVRMPATAPSGRIGSLVMNPGGPGGSGVDFLTRAGARFFPASLRERFDIVSFDPRGVGASSPVDCLDDKELDAYFAIDLTPDHEMEYGALVENARLLADACWEVNGDLLRHMGTENVIRDLERIRLALGGEPLNYVGLSYGTKIGALYAERYPGHIRAMVLDGIDPPHFSMEELLITQSAGTESAMRNFLSWCADAPECAFGQGDPEADFLELMSGIDQWPLFAEERILGPSEAFWAVVGALYSRERWPDLADALSAAKSGDPDSLLLFFDHYHERAEDGTYSSLMEANMAIRCIDAPWPSPDDFRDLGQEAESDFPFFGAANVNASLPCAFWRVEPVSGPEVVRAAGAPPLLLIGTTNDLATPYDWAVETADQMESAVLLTLEGEGHVAMGRKNTCIDNAVRDYLTDLILPGGERRCEEEPRVSASGASHMVSDRLDTDRRDRTKILPSPRIFH